MVKKEVGCVVVVVVGAGKQFNYEPAARGILGHGSIPLGVTVCLRESGMKNGLLWLTHSRLTKAST